MASKHPLPSNHIQDEALFRYQVVSFVLSRETMGDLRVVAIAKAVEMVHQDGKGKARRISARSIYRWLKAYQQKGIDGLGTQLRPRIKDSLAVNQEQLAFFKQQKEEDPKASIPELIKRAILKGLVRDRGAISRTSVWRALNRVGVNTDRGRVEKRVFAKRFAYPHRCDMVLCDGKHFRAGVTHSKRVVLSFLDDATRMILGVIVGFSETTQLFLRGFYEIIRAYGYPQRLYVDHGSGFIAKDTRRVMASMDIALIHGEKAYPEGHGKVERYNQTLLAGCLRHYDGNPDIDPQLSALEIRLDHYTREIYNQDPHESLNQQSPRDRFHEDPKPLHFPEDENELKRQFWLPERRVVSADNVVRFDGVRYEMPAGYARDAVMVYHNVLNEQISVIHEGRLVSLFPVDLVQNALEPRSSKGKPKESPSAPLVSSSADLAFNKDVNPLVDGQGNYLPKGETS